MRYGWSLSLLDQDTKYGKNDNANTYQKMYALAATGAWEVEEADWAAAAVDRAEDDVVAEEEVGWGRLGGGASAGGPLTETGAVGTEASGAEGEGNAPFLRIFASRLTRSTRLPPVPGKLTGGEFRRSR